MYNFSIRKFLEFYFWFSFLYPIENERITIDKSEPRQDENFVNHVDNVTKSWNAIFKNNNFFYILFFNENIFGSLLLGFTLMLGRMKNLV